MADEISAEIKMMHQELLTASRQSAGEVTTLSQRFDAAMAKMNQSGDTNLKAIVEQLRGVDKKFGQTVSDMERKAASVTFEKMASGLERLGSSARAVFSSTLGGGAGYETEIKNIAAISDLSSAQLRTLSGNLRTLGGDLGLAVGPAQTAAVALQAIGSGFEDAAASTQVTSSALKLIADRKTDAAAATKLLTDTLNSYGQGADQAARLTDVFFQVQNRGVVSIAQMSQSLGLVTSVAAAAGVSLEELGATIVVATKKGVPFTSVIEGTRGLITSLQNPTEKSEKAMAKYGLAINYATLKQDGLAKTLAKIKAAVGEDQAAFNDITGTQQAFALATAVASDGLKSFGVELQALKEAAGAADRSTKIIGEGFENSSKAFGAAVERLQVGASQTILPVATKVIKALTAVVDTVGTLPPGLLTLGLAATAGVAALGALAGAALFVTAQVIQMNATLLSAGINIPAMAAGASLAARQMLAKAAAAALLNKAIVGYSFANLGMVAGLKSLFSATVLTTGGLATLGVGVIAMAVAYDQATKELDRHNRELEKANKGIREFADATGKVRPIKEISRGDALNLSGSELVNQGFGMDDITAEIQDARKRAEEAQNDVVREKFQDQVRALIKKRDEIDQAIKAKGTATPQSSAPIQTEAQIKEATKEAIHRAEIDKISDTERISRLKLIMGQYRLIGDERRSIETKIAQLEAKVSKEAETSRKKAQAEGVKQAIQEVENSKRTTDQKIADLQAILKNYKVSADERRTIEDKVLAYEKSLQAERQKIAERSARIQVEASEERVKAAELELTRLQKLQEKGVETTPEQVSLIRFRAVEEKKKVDSKLEGDLVKEQDPINQQDLRTVAAREKADIERAAQAAITEVAEKGLLDRLQRTQEATQQEIAISKKRSDLLAAFGNPAQATSQVEQEGLRRLQLMIQEIDLQRQLTLQQTRDPALVAAAERQAQQQVLDARIQVREEIEATTRAIEEQQKKSKTSSSSEFGGNILSFEQFLQGESKRFETKSSDEFFGRGKTKRKQLPGLSDFDLRQGILEEAGRDPSRRVAPINNQTAASKSQPVEIRGEFVLRDTAGNEVGSLKRLTVNGRNSELNSTTKAMGL